MPHDRKNFLKKQEKCGTTACSSRKTICRAARQPPRRENLPFVQARNLAGSKNTPFVQPQTEELTLRVKPGRKTRALLG